MLLVFQAPSRVGTSQHGGYSQQFITSNKTDLQDLIFDTCPECHKAKKMSSVPQGAHAAFKIHSNLSKNVSWDIQTTKIHGYEKTSPNQKFQVNKQNLDHPLAKYNSKLMKSIWGMYNRYSVHNLKSFTDGEHATVRGAQQLRAAAAPISSGINSTGGFSNGLLSNPTWDDLKIGHTY